MSISLRRRWLLKACGMALLCAPLAGVGAAEAAQTVAAPLPVSAYVAPADFVQASLSADGRYLATLAPLKGKRNLVVMDLETMKPRALTGLSDFDVLRYHWVGSEFLVFTLGQLDTPTGPEQGNGGGLFAIRFDGTGFRKLSATVAEQVAKGRYRPLSFMRAVPGSGHEILAQTPDARTFRPEVQRIDLRSGERVSLTEDAPEDVEGWWLDKDGVPRLAVVADRHGKTPAEVEQVYLLRDSMNAPWREMARFKQADKDKWSSVFGFAADNRNLIINARQGHDTTGLYLFDVETRKVGEVLARHPRFDGSEARLLRDAADGRVVGLQMSDERQQTVYFDAGYARLQAAMEASFKDRAVDLQRSAAHGKTLVTVWSDRHPQEFFIYDEAARTLKPVLRSRRGLDERHLVAMQPFVLKTRDGLEIPSYYFLPADAKPGQRLPTVVHIHGGPHVRADRWGPLNSYGVREAQILASRGYAVVLPNFRITPGLGSKIYQAGWGEYGRRMSDDHEDAALWAVAQGFADPKRICISGASYGGSAALWATIKSAHVFRCGVAGLAVSDKRRQLGTILTDYADNESSVAFWKRILGVKGDNWAPADEVAPAQHAARSNIPLFLYAGEADRRVPVEQTRIMVSALKAAGKPPEVVMVKSEEGHGYGKQENRVELYEEMLKFLDRHIGSGFSAGSPPAQ